MSSQTMCQAFGLVGRGLGLRGALSPALRSYRTPHGPTKRRPQDKVLPHKYIRATVLGLMCLVLAGCGGSTSRSTPITIFPDMDYQRRYDPQTERAFFTDQRASRTPVKGTVARGLLKEDNVRFTGVVDGQYVGRNPLTVNADLLKVGQRRFNTYCSPCHDRTGQGRGVVAQRAIWIPTNLHEPRVKTFNDGEIFSVITEGRRSMPSYRFQITEDDRWAIVAYVRALQRTSEATMADVPADQQTGLK